MEGGTVTITAKDLMHRDLTAVAEDDLVLDAVRILYMQRLSGLPVVMNDWILVGFLSESDILRFTLPTYLEILAQKGFLDNSEGNLIERLGRLGHKAVGEFMNRDPICVEPEVSLMTVADLMIRKRIKRLPVVKEGRLLGIIDRSAFCEFLMEEAHEGRP